MLGRNVVGVAIRVAMLVSALAIASTAQQAALPAKPTPVSGDNKSVPNGAAPESTSDSKPSRPAGSVGDVQVYRIGVEDELTISVWREPELSPNVVVRPDGIITLPLLNEVKVTGLTTSELQNLLTDRLKEFIKEPQVTVIVRQIRSRKIYLIGEVVHPGTYALNSSKTVLQLLAEAGGPGPYAKVGSIYVIRQKNGAQTRLPFHYKRAVSGAKSSADIMLQPGDMVVVP